MIVAVARVLALGHAAVLPLAHHLRQPTDPALILRRARHTSSQSGGLIAEADHHQLFPLDPRLHLPAQAVGLLEFEDFAAADDVDAVTYVRNLFDLALEPFGDGFRR